MQTTLKPEHHDKHPGKQPRLVIVKIDGNPHEIAADTYQVPALKALLGVPPDYELELVKGGKFHPLADEETYKVHGHEEFLSHVRCGGSS
jgi:predicted metallopeptidase